MPLTPPPDSWIERQPPEPPEDNYSPALVLVACEFSGVVREAFNAYHGVDAYSCDLRPCSDGRPENHIQADVFEALKRRPWDLLIAHPPCTYLSSSGLHWIKRGRIEKDGRSRLEHHQEALEFVRKLLAADVPRIALENPTGAIGSQIRPADQWIQPHEFGDDASKKTGLWLKNLPPLAIDPARYVMPRAVCSACGFCEAAAKEVRDRMFTEGCPECGAPAKKIRPRWANQTDSGQNKLAPTEDPEERQMERAVTYPGIAAAMAAQWTPLIT